MCSTDPAGKSKSGETHKKPTFQFLMWSSPSLGRLCTPGILISEVLDAHRSGSGRSRDGDIGTRDKLGRGLLKATWPGLQPGSASSNTMCKSPDTTGRMRWTCERSVSPWVCALGGQWDPRSFPVTLSLLHPSPAVSILSAQKQ